MSNIQAILAALFAIIALLMSLRSSVRPLSTVSPVLRSASRRNMHIEAFPMSVGKSNNYAYLISDNKTKDAVIIDPAFPEDILQPISERVSSGAVTLKTLINTHHHWDHAGGNEEFLKHHKLPVLGGKDCAHKTSTPAHNSTMPLSDASSVKITALHTPCHTQDSICWYFQDGSQRAVFTGDTLFIGGCGRFFEGTPAEMDKALNQVLAGLPDDTKVYPGHEYTKANVAFGWKVLQNEGMKRLKAFSDANGRTEGTSTIGQEKEHNVFMRLSDPTIQKATGETDPVSVMGKLREMKNAG